MVRVVSTVIGDSYGQGLNTGMIDVCVGRQPNEIWRKFSCKLLEHRIVDFEIEFGPCDGHLAIDVSVKGFAQKDLGMHGFDILAGQPKVKDQTLQPSKLQK